MAERIRLRTTACIRWGTCLLRREHNTLSQPTAKCGRPIATQCTKSAFGARKSAFSHSCRENRKESCPCVRQRTHNACRGCFVVVALERIPPICPSAARAAKHSPRAAALAACLQESREMTEARTPAAAAVDALPRAPQPIGWIIPPVVIPAIAVLLVVAMAISRALAL